jgi:hypothetical protein
VWFLIRGLSVYTERGKKQHITGAMIRDFAEKHLEQNTRSGEKHAPAYVILGVIEQTGVLVAEETENEAFIRFADDHPLVRACFKCA